jgi:hypothetical protein
MIRPPMGLRSGGCSLAVAGSCGGGAVLESPLDGGGHMVGAVRSEAVMVATATLQIRPLGSPVRLPLHPPLVLGFQWVDPVGRSGSVSSACTTTLVAWIRAPG